MNEIEMEYLDEPVHEVQLCIPVCDPALIPVVGRAFPTIEDGIEFYDNYASACGFKTRKSTRLKAKDGTTKIRYLLCNREGFKSETAPKRKRKTTTTRCYCMARIAFQFESDVGFRITTFNEGHTHDMLPVALQHLMTSNRQVDMVHQMFIHAGVKANIGPIRTFRFYKEIVGSYEEVGATSTDFKNYSRDLKAYVEGRDAQIVLNNLKYKKENCAGFVYFFDVDVAGNLKRLFWADKKCIKNYQLFGDAISFDATYSTNRYKMIYTPFTGRDNHGGCVTFGAALIFNEDVESYTWVLQKFADCMVDHPKLIVTDQDPALRKAVPTVFPNTRHRFCLWHITKKVPDKISVALRSDPDFKSEFDGLIWSELDEPHEFEEKWHVLMVKYGLTTDKWFLDMFELRMFWIPAYFRDVSMSGLFKTTSLSGSENSFFKRYLNRNDDLVRFLMHYNSAMDAQRNLFKTITMTDETEYPAMKTDIPMEEHAAKVYTIKKFYEVQEEIVAAVIDCVIYSMKTDGHLDIYEIDDGTHGIAEVSYDKSANTLECVCKSFIRRGIPCRHMIFVMRTRRMRQIPDVYILKRWSKLSTFGLYKGDDYFEPDTHRMTGGKHQLFVEFCRTIVAVQNDNELQVQLLSDMKELCQKFSKLGVDPDTVSSKKSIFEMFYDCQIPEQIDVGPPEVASTKGSGVGGRRKSLKEKAIEAAKKNLRNCRNCHKLVPHDSRNCPEK